MAAAEAGVDNYISKLTEDHTYYGDYVHPGEATRKDAAGVVGKAGLAWTGALDVDVPQRSRQVAGHRERLRVRPADHPADPGEPAREDHVERAQDRQHDEHPHDRGARTGGVGGRLPDGVQRRRELREHRHAPGQDLRRHRQQQREAQHRPCRRRLRRPLRRGLHHAVTDVQEQRQGLQLEHDPLGDPERDQLQHLHELARGPEDGGPDHRRRLPRRLDQGRVEAHVQRRRHGHRCASCKKTERARTSPTPRPRARRRPP